MFVKNLLDKALHKQHEVISANKAMSKKPTELDVHIPVHYGIPYTASTMAFDPIQRLLAIGTLDGRIKIIGGDNIEGLLISPKKVPYKHLEFLQNQGFLVAITNENVVEVWNLEFRQLFCSSQWETNLTAFAVVPGTSFIFLGDENGLFSVLKYDLEDGKIKTMPYQIPLDSLAEKTGISSLNPQSIVGILPQPNTFGTRVLIAYQRGLLVLWDITENHATAIRGNGDLHLKQNNFAASDLAEASEEEEEQEEEKEICTLCWVSSTGSVAAVGYTTGDIYLWNLSPNKSISRKGKETESMNNNALKLQLASGDRRLPVIVLHWSPSLRGEGDKGGHLFIYGGDEMGSEEVLTVLSIEFPTGLESMRLISRVDLRLNGSFADMILIPDSAAPEKTPSALFVLTNPGQLNIYDCTHFSTKKAEDGESYAHGEKFPILVPTVDPNITITKLCPLSTKVLKKFHATKAGRPSLLGGTKWPLTGGVPSEMSLSKDCLIERMYIAGYNDGSVRIWDSSFPILELMFVLNGKLAGMGVGGENVSVSALAFSSTTLTLAVGDECGLVRVYKLHENVDHEGHMSPHRKEIQCDAAAMVSNSPIRTLNFTKTGQFLSVGFENGQVAMLEVSNLSAVFCTDFSPETSSPVISILEAAAPGVLSPGDDGPSSPKLPKELLVILTRNARLSVLDALTGDPLSSLVLCAESEVNAISMHALDVNGKEAKETLRSHESHEAEIQAIKVENSNSDESSSSDNLASDQLLLICCGNVLLLHSLSQILTGFDKHLKKIELPELCCWSVLYHNVEKKSLDLLLVYQTGSMEIRSVPDLEIVGQSSLMSILRWSFKTNMDKTMSSSDGQISLVNGSELAIISIPTSENSFRIPESSPCLHDKVLAAAVEAAIRASNNLKRKQEQIPSILGGIVKGLKGGRGDDSPRFTDENQLDTLLSSFPFTESSLDALDEEEDINIDDIIIDDVEIDEPMGCGPSSTQKVEKHKQDNDRDMLFEGSSDALKPRMRTQQEILTKYKFGGDASAAAAHAKEKLMQRQEKLDRLSQRTAELQDGAENFANLANELVRNMEKKKWWNI